MHYNAGVHYGSTHDVIFKISRVKPAFLRCESFSVDFSMSLNI